MQETSHINPAKDFFIHNLAFIILYAVIAYFVVKLSKLSSNSFVDIANILLLFCAFSIIAVISLIAKSMIHIDPTTVDTNIAKRNFILSKVFFRLSILLFFSVVFLWILALGGIFSSAFSALLTTAPVFFIFVNHAKYSRIFNGYIEDEWIFKVYFWEKLLMAFTYIIYVASVLSIDFSYIGNLFGIDLFANPLLSFVDPSSTTIKSSAHYQFMSVIIFLGSIIAVICPYLSDDASS